MKSYSQILTEGVYDQGIFKAFFMAGGPGSGKSYVAGKTTAGLGLKVVNSDIVFENYLKQAMNILIAEDQGAIPLHSQYVVVGTTDKVDYTPRADEAFEVMLAKKAN